MYQDILALAKHPVLNLKENKCFFFGKLHVINQRVISPWLHNSWHLHRRSAY